MRAEVSVLVDVDNTLIIGIDPTDTLYYHNDLIKALVSSGIKNVSLFTNMGFKPREIEEREALKQYLAKQSITVDAVITPADFAWHLPFEQLKSAVEYYEKNDRFDETDTAVVKLLAGDLSEQKSAGQAFRDATTNTAEDYEERASLCGRLAKMIEQHRVINNKIEKKVLMFEQFSSTLPSAVTKVIFIDDEQKCFAGAQSVSAKQTKFTLTTIDPWIKKPDVRKKEDSIVSELKQAQALPIKKYYSVGYPDNLPIRIQSSQGLPVQKFIQDRLEEMLTFPKEGGKFSLVQRPKNCTEYFTDTFPNKERPEVRDLDYVDYRFILEVDEQNKLRAIHLPKLNGNHELQRVEINGFIQASKDKNNIALLALHVVDEVYKNTDLEPYVYIRGRDASLKDMLKITHVHLSTLINSYQSSARFFKSPGPELIALQALLTQKNGSIVTINEIRNALTSVGKQKGANKNRIELLDNPDLYPEDKTGVSLVIRNIGRVFANGDDALQSLQVKK